MDLLLHGSFVPGAVTELIRAQALKSQEFESRPSQTNDLTKVYMSLPSLMLSIIRIGKGLVS